MILPFFKKRLRDISISHKLYFTVGIMALLVTVELCTLWFSVSTLSAVRAFVNGEGLWSKAEKDAVLNLRLYAYSHNETDYLAFKRFLEVPVGDKQTRMELLKADPDYSVARLGLLEGRNEADDIDGMIRLIRRFHSAYYLNKAFTLWAQAEPLLGQLTQIGDNLHNKIILDAPQSEIDQTLEKLSTLNRQLTRLEDGFSFTLGEGARWLEDLVLKVLLSLSLTIGTTSIIITISVSRNLEKGITAIIDGAELVSEGTLDKRVPIYSLDEIGMLASAFNEMTDRLAQNTRDIQEKEENLKKEKERAETSEKVKHVFLMNMSHEIRTPMNAILGFAHLLDEALAETEHKKYIRLLIRAGDELLMLINDILDFSKLESEKIILESIPFNLRTMVDAMLSSMQVKARAKDLHLTAYLDKRVPALILGDALRLNQVLVNLLSNAIKFTDRGEVNLLVYCIHNRQRNIELEFSIKDTGIGIPDDEQENIFQSFEQASTGSERKFGGTGLGLSIVKQLVEAQGGKVFVNSTPGRGSEFHFRITFSKVKPGLEDGEMKINGTPITKYKGPKVLVVDDNPMNRLLVVKILQKKDFDTDLAENGKVALSKCIVQDYDLILMDLQMPEMDGYEATKYIRELPGKKGKVPIIAMTAHSMEGEQERCMALGMSGFISKPFYPDVLHEKIKELISVSV